MPFGNLPAVQTVSRHNFNMSRNRILAILMGLVIAWAVIVIAVVINAIIAGVNENPSLLTTLALDSIFPLWAVFHGVVIAACLLYWLARRGR
jgi:F0F1-type ATP synthase membrane subunit c/vacuolar-type H+-ATPase subunit K